MGYKIQNPASSNVKGVKKSSQQLMKSFYQKNRPVRPVPDVYCVSKRHLIYVNQLLGNDGTGTKGDKTKPFQTITAALAIAVSGDTLFIEVGNYTDNNLNLIDGVNLYFTKEAKMTNSTSNSIFNIISDIKCVIYGQASFYSNTASIISGSGPFNVDLIVEGKNFISNSSFNIITDKCIFDVIGDYFYSSDSLFFFAVGAYDLSMKANVINTPYIIEMFVGSLRANLCYKQIYSGSFVINTPTYYIFLKVDVYNNNIGTGNFQFSNPNIDPTSAFIIEAKKIYTTSNLVIGSLCNLIIKCKNISIDTGSSFYIGNSPINIIDGGNLFLNFKYMSIKTRTSISLTPNFGILSAANTYICGKELNIIGFSIGMNYTNSGIKGENQIVLIDLHRLNFNLVSSGRESGGLALVNSKIGDPLPVPNAGGGGGGPVPVGNNPVIDIQDMNILLYMDVENYRTNADMSLVSDMCINNIVIDHYVNYNPNSGLIDSGLYQIYYGIFMMLDKSVLYLDMESFTNYNLAPFIYTAPGTYTTITMKNFDFWNKFFEVLPNSTVNASIVFYFDGSVKFDIKSINVDVILQRSNNILFYTSSSASLYGYSKYINLPGYVIVTYDESLVSYSFEYKCITTLAPVFDQAGANRVYLKGEDIDSINNNFLGTQTSILAAGYYNYQIIDFKLHNLRDELSLTVFELGDSVVMNTWVDNMNIINSIVLFYLEDVNNIPSIFNYTGREIYVSNLFYFLTGSPAGIFYINSDYFCVNSNIDYINTTESILALFGNSNFSLKSCEIVSDINPNPQDVFFTNPGSVITSNIKLDIEKMFVLLTVLIPNIYVFNFGNNVFPVSPNIIDLCINIDKLLSAISILNIYTSGKIFYKTKQTIDVNNTDLFDITLDPNTQLTFGGEFITNGNIGFNFSNTSLNQFVTSLLTKIITAQPGIVINNAGSNQLTVNAQDKLYVNNLPLVNTVVVPPNKLILI